MIIERKSEGFKDYDASSFVSYSDLIKMLDQAPTFKSKLLSIFKVDEKKIEVYQDISIGDNGRGGSRIVNGEITSLRAVDFIELLPSFEVELGGKLYADAHECGQ